MTTWRLIALTAACVTACDGARGAGPMDGAPDLAGDALDAELPRDATTPDADADARCSMCTDSGPTPSCEPPEVACEGRCVDLRSDRRSCGTCGRRCTFGQICVDAECVEDTCDFPGIRCGGTCVDSSTNAAHCGACDRSCGASGRCEGSTCRCDDGAIACGGTCIDPSNDASNCGACGAVCPIGESCIFSECVPSTCSGEARCDGRCTLLDRDPDHCGACGRACTSDETCESGECTCRTGLVRCGDACVDLATDAAHCGSCDRTCWTLPFCIAPTCLDGRCAAAPPSILCEGRCVFWASDPDNCGACGAEVPEGFVCREGRPVCFGGQVCDGLCYALDLPDRCGACTAVCEGEIPVCQRFAGGAACRAACDAGLEPCDGTCRDTQSNPRHCGGCGRSCGPRQACAEGRCVCAGDYPDCGADGTLECADLRYDSANCGACDVECPRGTYCLLERCVPL